MNGPGPGALPVGACISDLKAALSRHGVVLLSAPTGSGKTTTIPPALLDLPVLGSRKILMLEPRRLAARLACEWMASALHERPGATIGYRTGCEAAISGATRIEVMTEGVLTRRLQRDPELADTGLVIFDEVHERHLATDLGLALVRDIQSGLRPDLRILLMSATLAGEALTQHFPNAPLVQSQGRQFPVAIEYLQGAAPARLDARVRDGVQRILTDTSGDVLVFLPGMREIVQCERALAGDMAAAGLVLCRLHGAMSAAEQDRVRAPDGPRRVILASAVAQSSITLPRVDGVVDTGLMRTASFDHGNGFARLVTMPASQDIADQRAGRAGRVRPGRCLRLWTQADQRGRPRFARPEIEHTDLGAFALDLAAWGTPDAAGLDWLTPPPKSALAAARRHLAGLGLAHSDGSITAAGRRTVAYGLHPRLGSALAQAEPALHPLICALAAVLEEGGAIRDRDDAALATRLAWLRRHPDSVVGQRMRRLARRARVPAWNGEGADDDVLAGLLVPVYGDRIARRVETGDTAVFKLACGPRSRIARADPLSREETLLALEVEETAEGPWIRLAVPLRGPAWARAEQSATEHVRVWWDERTHGFSATRERRLGEIRLRTVPSPVPMDADLVGALEAALRDTGLTALPWTEEARAVRARLAWIRSVRPAEDWPDVGEAALVNEAARWLAAAVVGPAGQDTRASVDVAAGLRHGLISPAQRLALERLAPAAMALRSGRRYPLRYPEGTAPVLAAPVQEFFGMRETPRLDAGRIAVTLELLSPARRPLQVTSDLAGFWRTAYADLRRALAARYPRHEWPPDPLSPPPLRPRPRRT
ncbi:ATP-dependent helicase HrpB [Acidiferrobacter sp.]|uniref:ATP-dependent helicase HrpB n=1 Tax=Acidiferrobacter sp. TaxID=1872107 RepID=UPI002613517E|nr:ATP-dependent helicase HrpB [Acidiferrobacter sp.]